MGSSLRIIMILFEFCMEQNREGCTMQRGLKKMIKIKTIFSKIRRGHLSSVGQLQL